MVKKVPSHVTMQKVIPQVNDRCRKLWDVPSDHESVGLIACDIEDVMDFALDNTSLNAPIKVLHVDTVYGGAEYSWSRFGGEISAVISGPKVEDVRSGLKYTREYIERHCGAYIIDDDKSMGYYVDCLARIGRYNQARYGLPEDTSLALLVSSPVEAAYGIDKALKASETKVIQLSGFPSRVNTGGAVLYGTEAACKSAVQAFAEAVQYCYAHPMDLGPGT